jgi:hypothetical protein
MEKMNCLFHICIIVLIERERERSCVGVKTCQREREREVGEKVFLKIVLGQVYMAFFLTWPSVIGVTCHIRIGYVGRWRSHSHGYKTKNSYQKYSIVIYKFMNCSVSATYLRINCASILF